MSESAFSKDAAGSGPLISSSHFGNPLVKSLIAKLLRRMAEVHSVRAKASAGDSRVGYVVSCRAVLAQALKTCRVEAEVAFVLVSFRGESLVGSGRSGALHSLMLSMIRPKRQRSPVVKSKRQRRWEFLDAWENSYAGAVGEDVML